MDARPAGRPRACVGARKERLQGEGHLAIRAVLLAALLLALRTVVGGDRCWPPTVVGLRWGHQLGLGAPVRGSAQPLALLDREALLVASRQAIKELRANTSSAQSDHDLLAHLRAAALNRQSPSRRVLETDAWRRSSGIAAKMSDKQWKQAERDIRHVLKCDYLGLDAAGRPVLVQHVGKWDVDAVEAVAEDLDRFVMLNAMICEVLLRTRRPAGAKDARGTIVIMDMEGLGMRHISTKMLRAFKSVAHVVRRFYPDILAHMFVVNAPWVFLALKAAIQPLFDADSLSALHISSGVPPEILGLSERCLPVELGGCRRRVFPYDDSATPSEWRI